MIGHENNIFKVINVGDFSVGKTSLIDVFINGKQFSPDRCTNHWSISDFITKPINTKFNLYIWDTCSQELFSP